MAQSSTVDLADQFLTFAFVYIAEDSCVKMSKVSTEISLFTSWADLFMGLPTILVGRMTMSLLK